jgi:DNA-binding IclR family transcriptional regulator
MSERYSKAAIRTRAIQSAAERAILIALAEQANDEGLGALDWDHIAKEAGMPRSQVMEIVARLTYRTIIIDGGGKGLYRMNIPL